MNQFEKARQKFKPKEIKYLLIAETPPKSYSNRFFYFENVEKQDSLFLETMKLLYSNETELLKPKEIRNRKKKFLEKFKDDGFYLIDSLDQPFEKKYSSSQKVKLIKNGQQQLFGKVQSLLSKNTKVVLIAVPVFKANFHFLKCQNIPIINEEAIDFPGSGGQTKFKEKMRRILNQNNYLFSDSNTKKWQELN